MLFRSGKLPAGAVPSARTEGRGATFFSANAFDGANVERTRTGLEGAVAVGPIKFQAEYVKSDYDGTSKVGKDFSRGIDAWYASVNWLISGERYADNYRNGAFGRIRPNNNFSPSAAGMGAWELGLRYTNFDASDFKNGNDPGTGVIATTVANKANAYTVGLKWLPTPNTRFLLNYIQTKFDTPVTSGGIKADDEKAVTFRAQLDF